MKFTDPYGRGWRVRRQWLAFRRRKMLNDLPDIGETGADLVSGTVAVIVQAPKILLWIVLVVVEIGQLIVRLILAPFALVLRLCRATPWKINAVFDSRTYGYPQPDDTREAEFATHSFTCKGFVASGRLRDAVGEHLKAGGSALALEEAVRSLGEYSGTRS